MVGPPSLENPPIAAQIFSSWSVTSSTRFRPVRLLFRSVPDAASGIGIFASRHVFLLIAERVRKAQHLMADPTPPIDAYKALIDQLVNETSRSVMARNVAERGAFPETSAHAVFNDLIGSLPAERRRLLSQMLEEE